MTNLELKERLNEIKAWVMFFGWAILGSLELQFGKTWPALAFLALATLTCVWQIRIEWRFWSKVWDR
jgi:hypothetical protein